MPLMLHQTVSVLLQGVDVASPSCKELMLLMLHHCCKELMLHHPPSQSIIGLHSLQQYLIQLWWQMLAPYLALVPFAVMLAAKKDEKSIFAPIGFGRPITLRFWKY